MVTTADLQPAGQREPKRYLAGAGTRVRSVGVVELLTVLVAGAIGVGGTALGHWLQARTRSRERAEDLRQQGWEAKRESYEELCRAVDLVDSAAGGALVAGGKVPSDVGKQLRTAAVIVELHAEPEVWAKIKPAVDAVSLRANALVGGSIGDEAVASLRRLGAHEPEGMDRLRAQMLSAMRADLQR